MFNFSFEWLPFAVLAILSYFGWPWTYSAFYTILTYVVWQYVPPWIYAVVASIVLHFTSLSILRLATVPDSKNTPIRDLIKEVKWIDIAVFAFLEGVDLLWRNRPERIALFGAMTAVLGLFVILSLLFEDPSKLGSRNGQSTPQGSNQAHQQTENPQTSQTSSPESTNQKNQKKCANCGATDTKLWLCSGCSRVFYCSTQCQKEHRPAHKAECGGT